jgi:hypothetical protein
MNQNMLVPVILSSVFSGIIAALFMSVTHVSLLLGIGASSTLSFLLLLCFSTKESWGEMSGVIYK